MPWFSIYEQGTNRLISLGTVVNTAQLPSNYIVRVESAQPGDNLMWSESVAGWILRPLQSSANPVLWITDEAYLMTRSRW